MDDRFAFDRLSYNLKYMKVTFKKCLYIFNNSFKKTIIACREYNSFVLVLLFCCELKKYKIRHKILYVLISDLFSFSVHLIEYYVELGKKFFVGTPVNRSVFVSALTLNFHQLKSRIDATGKISSEAALLADAIQEGFMGRGLRALPDLCLVRGQRGGDDV